MHFRSDASLGITITYQQFCRCPFLVQNWLLREFVVANCADPDALSNFSLSRWDLGPMYFCAPTCSNLPSYTCWNKFIKVILARASVRVSYFFDCRLFIAFAMVENTSRTSELPRTASLTIVSTMPIWKSFRIRLSIIFPFLPATIAHFMK